MQANPNNSVEHTNGITKYRPINKSIPSLRLLYLMDYIHGALVKVTWVPPG
jgi:hypothetical protein